MSARRVRREFAVEATLALLGARRARTRGDVDTRRLLAAYAAQVGVDLCVMLIAEVSLW